MKKMVSDNFNLMKGRENIPLEEQLCLQHLNPEEKVKLIPVIRKYSHIFYQENTKLSFTSAIKHQIRTKNNNDKSYKYPFVHKNEVQDLTNNGIILHTNSPYYSLIWIAKIVAKKAETQVEIGNWLLL